MSQIKETARMSTGGKRKPQEHLPDNAYGKQIKEEAGSRPVVIVETNDDIEEKFDPNMVFKTEEGSIANRCDLAAEQGRVNLVKNLISKNEKLEAEMLAKDARLEELLEKMVEVKNTAQAEVLAKDARLKELHEEMVDMKHTYEAELLVKDSSLLQLRHDMETAIRIEKSSFDARLDQLKRDSDALIQRHTQETRVLADENRSLKEKLERQKVKIRPLQRSLRPLVPKPQQRADHSSGGQTTRNAQSAVIRLPVQQNLDRKSAKMLVILESGEQRLITFTLPKETCTAQELLDEVGIQVGADSKFECIENTGSEIDYVVKIGNFGNKGYAMMKAAENHIRQQKKLQQQLNQNILPQTEQNAAPTMANQQTPNKIVYMLQAKPDGMQCLVPPPEFSQQRLPIIKSATPLAQHSQTVLQQNQQQVEEKIAVEK